MTDKTKSQQAIIATPRGFCAGVIRAIDIVKLAIKKYPPPIYIKHQIVHNDTVVDELSALGTITVETVAEVPEGQVVVFSAHGSSPADYAVARERNLTVIDATCPLVTKVHNEAIKSHKENKKIVLIGHSGHQETLGTSGYAPMYHIDERTDWQLPNYDADEEIVVLTQTTLSVDDTKQAVDELKTKFNNLHIKNDICYATTNRQASVKELAKMVDVIVIVGSKQSSNCTRMKEIAEACGVKAFQVLNKDELNLDWLRGYSKIGITSSASTPESDVDKVIKKINPAKTRTMGPGQEEIIFKLPEMVS